MAVVVDYPPCVRPGEGGLLVPVADWLSASTLEKMKAKVAVLNKDRGFEFKLAASEVIKLPFSYAVEWAVAEYVPPVLLGLSILVAVAAAVAYPGATCRRG